MAAERQIQTYYAGLTIYFRKKVKRGRYEERIVMVRAATRREALAKLKKEARHYAALDPDTELLHYGLLFDTMDRTIEDGQEVWSLLRDSALTPGKYLARHHGDDLLSMLVSEWRPRNAKRSAKRKSSTAQD